MQYLVMLRLAPVGEFIVLALAGVWGCGGQVPSGQAGTGGASAAMGGASGAVAAPGGASGANGGAAAPLGAGGVTGAGGQPPTPTPPLDGTWAMFAFEDPVAIEIAMENGVVGGEGCYAGLPQPFDSLLDSCSPIFAGSVVGNHVQFSFNLGAFPGLFYAADGFVSADGKRMAGKFHDTSQWGGPTAWLRISPTDRWLSTVADPSLAAAFTPRNGQYDLTLKAGAAGAGQEFETGRVYQLWLQNYLNELPMILGDLGAFWMTEMSWQEQPQVLQVGPVPATDPSLPVALNLHFDGTVLNEIEATTPSGATYLFAAAPHVP